MTGFGYNVNGFGVGGSGGDPSAAVLVATLQAAYSGYSITAESSDRGIYMLGDYANTRQVSIDTSTIGAAEFKVWVLGAGGATISVWGAGHGGGGAVAQFDNTGGTMVCTMGGQQGGWNSYTAGYNGGDSEVTYNGNSMEGEGSSGASSGTQGSYSNGFSGGAGGSGGAGASSGAGGDSQYGGGGGAGSNASQGYGGDGYNYGGGGSADSGRSSNSMNGSGGSSYGYGCKGQCNGAAYYGCSPCANHGGGGMGADIVVSRNGAGMIVIQWDDGIKSTLSSYDASATNF